MNTGRSLAKLIVIAVVMLPLVSCSFFDQVGALRTFRDANSLYGRKDYEAAVKAYREVLEVVQESPDSNLSQRLTAAYFYMGNSYDNLYKPARRGEPENDAHLREAEKYYRFAAERIVEPDLQKLSMQYLVSVFNADKLNDPSQSEPVLRQMIQIDPGDPDNYFALARLYEESGLFEDAEAVMLEVKALRPDDPTVYLQLAGFYNRGGEFEQTIEALEQRAIIEPDNPEAYYTISTYYWEKAFRDFRLTQDQKWDYVIAGIEASDKAIDLNERYTDALVYKNILLRMQANMTENFDEQQALIAQADELRDRAQDLQEQQRTGATAGAGE